MSQPEDEGRDVPSASSVRRNRGRPRAIDSAKLLSVAREVFLAKGIRATTLEVAEKAGVSEGILFHRFKTKEALFRAAVQLDPEDAPRRFSAMLQAIDGLELEPALIQLAHQMLELGRVALPLMMMSWSNPNVCGPNSSFSQGRPGYQAFLRRLINYFELQIQEGKLRRMDAEVFARSFVGSIHHYCMTKLLVGDDDGLILPEGMFVRGLVDLLLRGASPSGAASATTAPIEFLAPNR